MPNFALFFNSDPIIIIHALAAFAALFMGIGLLLMTKGTDIHRFAGRVWVLFMLIVAISSFWISGIAQLGIGIGPFSPIHLLSVWTIYMLYRAVVHIRSGHVQKHQRAMKSLFYMAIVGAGFFTFMPGRLMFNVFFSN